MKKDKEQLIKDFIGEAEELIEELSSDIKNLEKDVKENKVKPALINKLFREYHSIKGLSSMLGFEKISLYTHELENLLDKMRLGKVQINDSIVDILYESLDTIQNLISEIQQGEDKIDISIYRDRIIEAQEIPIETEEKSISSFIDLDEQTIKSFTEYEEHRLKENLRLNKNIYCVKLILDMSTFDTDLRIANEKLSETSEIISTLPSYDQSLGLDKMVFRLIIGTSEDKKAIEKIIQPLSAEVINIRKGESPAVKEEKPPMFIEKEEAAEEEEAPSKAVGQFVRVDVQKLDEVMNIIGELFILKSLISNLSYEAKEIPQAELLSNKLQKASFFFEKRLNELQRSLIEIRLVPIGQIYNRLSRMVRKLAKAAQKEINLQFFGGDTELDKMMIELLFDPLIHLIRNCIDHGIESPEERRKLNKPEVGIISLNAFQRGNNVVIEVSDDGRGLDLQKLKAKAISMGLILTDQEFNMQKATEVIFMPGFSTSEDVSEISGRGVGLDVVKRNISNLNGIINVKSEEGKGTIFEITLPITLAIIQSLIVKINGIKFALPMSSVLETLKATAQDIKTIDKKEVVILRGKTIPLIRVDEVLNLRNNLLRENNDSCFIVIVRIADQNMGIITDELIGQQQVVIKSLGQRFKDLIGIAGATEIGEENPILILDPAGLAMIATSGRLKMMH